MAMKLKENRYDANAGQWFGLAVDDATGAVVGSTWGDSRKEVDLWFANLVAPSQVAQAEAVEAQDTTAEQIAESNTTP
jgi:hypothetical protein